MKKQLLINAGLLLAVVILLLMGLNTRDQAQTETIRLTGIDVDSIMDIKVRRDGMETLAFNRKQQEWYLTSPLELGANVTRIQAMLRLLNIEPYAVFDAAEVDPDQLGLTQPKVSLVLNDHEFRFGITDGIDQRRYVQYQDRIYMTEDYLFRQLQTDAAFFAELKLLPENHAISAIRFPGNRLEKKQDQWQLQQLMDIKPQQLRQLVFAWKNASAVSASLFAAGEARPVIVIESEDGSQLRFEIVATEPYLILGRKDLGIQYNMGSDEAGRMLLNENLPTSTSVDTTADFFISD